MGVASVAYMTINNTLTQFNTDDHMRGRVMGLLGISIGLMPVGTLVAAAIAESVSAPFAIAMGGGAIVLFTLAMAVLIPRLRNL